MCRLLHVQRVQATTGWCDVSIHTCTAIIVGMFLCQKTCLPGDHDTSIHKSHRIHTHTRVYLTSVCISSSSESSDHLNYWASVSHSDHLNYSASVSKCRTKVTSLQYGKVGQKLLGFSIEISDKISISLFSGLCWTETPICNWGIAVGETHQSRSNFVWGRM